MPDVLWYLRFIVNAKETTDIPSPRLALTRVEAATALGVSAVTIDRLAQRGLFRPSRATRRPLYPTWELERFLRETSASLKS